jgi:hypothetical protein
MISNNTIKQEYGMTIQDQLSRMDKVADLIEKNHLFPDMKIFYKQAGLINSGCLGYGHFRYPIVEEASSDEGEDRFAEDESEVNEEFSDDEGTRKASVRMVCEKMIDKETIMSLVSKLA